MTGVEGAAGGIVGKVVEHAGKQFMEEQKNVKQELLSASKGSPYMAQAANDYARKIAIRQSISVTVYERVAKWFGVATEYYEGDFNQDFAEKMENVPEENIVPPKVSIAAPVMQGLAFSLDEPELKELYLKLLASASDNRVREEVHPAFVEVVRQLSAEEAPYLSNFLAEGAVPSARIKSEYKLESSRNGWTPVLDHVLDTPDEVPRLASFVDNWVRLGLAEVQYTVSFADKELYNWVENHPAVKRLQAEHSDPEREIGYDLGTLRATALGTQFARAVGVEREDDDEE